jgi:NTE family protein
MSSQEVTVDPGETYFAVARLPAGGELIGYFEAEGERLTVTLEPEVGEESLQESLEQSHYLTAPKETPAATSVEPSVLETLASAEPPTPAAQVTLRHIFGNPFTGSLQIKEEHIVQPVENETIDFDSGYEGTELVQIIQPVSAPITIAVPSAPGPSSTLRWVRHPAGYWSLDVHLADSVANLLVHYRAQGYVLQAAETLESPNLDAERLLRGKMGDPVAAAAGAYALLRFADLARLHDWTRNLYEWFDLADAAAIRGEHLARLGEHKQALEMFLALCDRGLPAFTDGLSYALDRLRLYIDTTGFEPALVESARDEFELLKRLAPIVDFGKPILTMSADPLALLQPSDGSTSEGAPTVAKEAPGRRERVSEPEIRVLEDAASPVHALGEPAEDSPEPGVALCLSGGGYRAMLFHLGALRRLNELGYLAKLDRVSSVSGGSITGGALGRNWAALDFDAAGVARGFDAALATPLHDLAARTIDVSSGIRGIMLPGSIADSLARSYRRHLLGDATLQDLPDRPRFVFNATNLQSGVLWRFSKPYMWDYRVGKIDHPTHDLATAVAASSAFPPFLSPLTLRLDADSYVPGTGKDLQQRAYMTSPVLTDGGVYDNLGLETAWKRYDTILVSDGGGHFSANSGRWANWAIQARRVLGVIDSQVRALRKRQVIDGFRAKQRKGAYWSIWSEIADFPLADPLPCPDERTKQLARLSTRLAKIDRTTQCRIVNWGYAVCDTAMRTHVERGAARPARFPFPNETV